MQLLSIFSIFKHEKLHLKTLKSEDILYGYIH